MVRTQTVDRSAVGRGEEERGQALVELAIVLLLLVVILAGMVDLGRALNAYIVITNAAREGARAGSLHVSGADLVPAVQARVIAEAAASGVDLSDPGRSGIEVGPVGPAGTPVTVTVTHQVPLIFAGLIFVGNDLQISSSASMIRFSGAVP